MPMLWLRFLPTKQLQRSAAFICDEAAIGANNQQGQVVN